MPRGRQRPQQDTSRTNQGHGSFTYQIGTSFGSNFVSACADEDAVDDADADDDDVTPKTQLIRFLCLNEAGRQRGQAIGNWHCGSGSAARVSHRYAY